MQAVINKINTDIISFLKTRVNGSLVLGEYNAIVGPLGLVVESEGKEKTQYRFNEGDNLSIVEIINDTHLLCNVKGSLVTLNKWHFKGVSKIIRKGLETLSRIQQ